MRISDWSSDVCSSDLADGDRRIDQGALGAVEIFDESLDAALVMELLDHGIGMPRVGQDDADAAVEEGELAQPTLEDREIELGAGEGDGGRREGDLGPGFAVAVSDDRKRRLRHAVAEAHEMHLA